MGSHSERIAADTTIKSRRSVPASCDRTIVLEWGAKADAPTIRFRKSRDFNGGDVSPVDGGRIVIVRAKIEADAPRPFSPPDLR